MEEAEVEECVGDVVTPDVVTPDVVTPDIDLAPAMPARMGAAEAILMPVKLYDPEQMADPLDYYQRMSADFIIIFSDMSCKWYNSGASQ